MLLNKVIIFDFDGVLADTLEDMLEFGRLVCARLGYQRTPQRSDLDALTRMSLVDYAEQLGIAEHQRQLFAQMCVEMFAQKETPHNLFDGMQAVLAHLSQANRLAIVSANGGGVIEKFLRYHQIEPHIEIVLGVESPGSKAEKICQIVERLEANHEDVFMVGDAASDIQAARQAGVHSIAVSWGHQSRQRLAQAQPDHLVDTPQELLNI